MLASEVVERGLEFGEVGSEPGEDAVLAGVVSVQRAAEGEAVPLEFVGRLGELPVAGQVGVDRRQRVVEFVSGGRRGSPSVARLPRRPAPA